jgi:ubiquinone/menaquinone biosynthesis C-methylase UbiE
MAESWREQDMSGLTFTDGAARHLEKTYRTKDIVAQRRETIRHLNLSAGEKVVDIGCGLGFLCEEMSKIVGRHGAVVGIDISPDLIDLCARREHPPWLSYEVGDATKLPQSDASFDVVVCTQVAEYIADVDVVLSEAFRILKPGGRTIFVATDWDALVWFSDDAKRMAAVLRSWEAHCAHPRLPRTMPHRVKSAGLRLDDAFVYALLNLSYDDDNYSKGLSTIIEKFVGGRGGVSASDLNAWLGEFERLNESGRYFFSNNRYIFTASRPVR